MSQATTDQLKLIDVRTPLRRALLLIPVALVLLGSWYSARWYLGNTLQEFAPGVEEGGIESTRVALDLAPNDPLVYWNAGNLESKSLDPNRLPIALQLYEHAVRLSPNDYRFWQDLGRAREQAGDIAGGEKAFRRAIELAPAYAYPHWHLGNLLLRSDRNDEAFVELRRAGEINSVFRGQVFNYAWEIYDGDVPAIEKVVGANAETRAQLAVFLSAKDRSSDAVRVWKNLSAEEKTQQRKIGEDLVKSLFQTKKYAPAEELARDLGLEAASGPGQIVNGDFEGNIAAPGTTLFGWNISQVPQVEMVLDQGARHGGTRSLRIVFNGFSKPGFYNVTQLVVVEPNTRYRFEGYVRTQDLKSGGTPLIEIADVKDGSILGASTPFTLGRNDWQQVTVDITTPDKSEAIYIRTNRAFCGEVCPIFGIIWYDDFNLQRIGAGSDGRKAGDAAR